jgi:hypothetical protein
VVSSHEFVLGGPGEGALRISLIDRDAVSNPRDRLDIRWVNDGAVRSVAEE